MCVWISVSQGVCNNVIGPPAHGSHEVTNPTHVSYSLANYKFFGTRVRFECDPGYVIQGEDSIECTQSGNIAEWSNSVPTCTAGKVQNSMKLSLTLLLTSLRLLSVWFTKPKTYSMDVRKFNGVYLIANSKTRACVIGFWKGRGTKAFFSIGIKGTLLMKL